MSTLVNLQYGYDRASNRKYRRDEVSRVQSTPKYFDELYGYDELNRLTSFARGELNVGNTTISSPRLGQTWTLDPTGNWPGFTQTEIDPLTQTRTHNPVNEITNIGESVGDEWPTPAYDANGNTTSFPDPRNLESGLTATYDAWNRLVKLENGSGTVAEYEYDGLNRRTTKTTASETRHAYFSDRWQVLEERVDSSTDAERQFLWGLRYVDDLVLRDRDTDGNGTLDERLYALSDALFNVVALTDDTGGVKERFAYQPYGLSQALDPDFDTYSGTNYEWQYRFTGRELDLESGLQINRNRYLHLELGRWLTKDPIGYGDRYNLYEYVHSSPTTRLDSYGLFTKEQCESAKEKALKKFKDIFAAMLERQGDGTTIDPGCKIPEVICTDCMGEHKGAGGFFKLDKNKIVFCLDRWKQNEEQIIEMAILHEFIHAFDACRDISGSVSCYHVACTEIRAYALSGMCQPGSPWRDPGQTREECVRANAIKSLELLPQCRPAKKWLDFSPPNDKSLFAKCYCESVRGPFPDYPDRTDIHGKPLPPFPPINWPPPKKSEVPNRRST